MDHYVDFLKSSGLFNDNDNPLPSRINANVKNVAGNNTKDMPTILSNNITLSDLLK